MRAFLIQITLEKHGGIRQRWTGTLAECFQKTGTSISMILIELLEGWRSFRKNEIKKLFSLIIIEESRDMYVWN